MSGLFTLKTVSYRTEFDREGSQERHDLMSVLADEVCMNLHSLSCCSVCFHSNMMLTMSCVSSLTLLTSAMFAAASDTSKVFLSR